VDVIVRKNKEKRAGDLGQAVDEDRIGVGPGKAAYDSMTDPYVGRKTSEKKASDIAMFERLGLPV
jgi:hypothetical protein